jgi:diguanylate cyclase (GGDEF)-like protein/PAS domain S-box-containing protein
VARNANPRRKSQGENILLKPFNFVRRALFSPQADLEDLGGWRASVLSHVLHLFAVIGAIVAIPSVLLALDYKLWSVAAVDVLALAWVVTLWRHRSLAFRARAWNFCSLIYLLGFSFLFSVGAASQIYLMACPVMAALLLGLRPALFSLALNAVTLLGVGYLAHTDLHLPGLEARPLLEFTVLAINFTFVSLIITMSTVVLLNGVEQSLEKKRDSEQLYRGTFDSAPVGVSQTDLHGRLLRVNNKMCEITGYSMQEMLGLNVQDIMDPDDLEAGTAIVAALLRGETDNLDREQRYLRKDGRAVWVDVRTSLARSDSGAPRVLVTVVTDITERKHADENIRRLNRVYVVLSAINSLIVRVLDRDTLYREACNIAVEAGLFLHAWIGVVDRETQDVHGVAWAGGDESFALLVRPTAENTLLNRAGLAAQAIATKKYALCNDIAAERATMACSEEALARGYRSAIGLPLIVEGEAIGAFVLYAAEPNFFDPLEIALLEELAGDIAFAQHHLAKLDQLNYLAYYDELTGLANATLFRERLGQLVAAGGREAKQLAVVMLNVERFKIINDTLGRHAGDQLLRQIAERCKHAIPDSSFAARTGGDHFAIVLKDIAGADESARLIVGMHQTIFDAPFDLNGTELRAAARFGIALFPNDGNDSEVLFRNAESALKNAKASGERFVFYAQQMTARVAERLDLENRMRRALKQEEFILHYQPKIDLTTGAITGVEALIRWNDPQSGLVPPAQFIPLLEETGLILEVGSWALTQAVRDHRHWLALGLRAPRIAVNVSPIQLRGRDFVETVREAIATGPLPPGIDLEITESLLMEDIDANIGKLNVIRDMGLSIFIDDFGTGYSSLGYLTRLPVQSLKIDRSFVIAMLEDPKAVTLVSTIITLAHSLKLKVVAEGVDKEEQAKILRSLRCDEMQGYLFSKPVARDHITTLVQRASLNPVAS